MHFNKAQHFSGQIRVLKNEHLSKRAQTGSVVDELPIWRQRKVVTKLHRFEYHVDDL